jgi:hypothetical protein
VISQDKTSTNMPHLFQNYVGDLSHEHKSGLSHIEAITS